MILVISTEPYLLIDDPWQSPFNVGLKISLSDFDNEQVQELNNRYHSPLRRRDISKVMQLLHGHPYLTRKALYTLVTQDISWSELVKIAADDKGPFSDHLRSQLWLLQGKNDLQKALKAVIRNGRHDDEKALFKLTSAGLVKGSGDDYECRCKLYQMYFKEKF